jgi:hypothetical protein
VESSGIGDPIVVPVHWHKTHTERITVREGRLEATLNGTTRIVFAGETLEVPPYATHGFKGFRGERLVVTETAYPAGDYKAAWVFSVFHDCPWSDLIAECEIGSLTTFCPRDGLRHFGILCARSTMGTGIRR